jgi:hypothetical protein
MGIFAVVFVLLGVVAVWGSKTVYEGSSESPETLLVWVDCDAEIAVARARELTAGIGSLSSRLRGHTWSPNKDYVWFLVETKSDKVSELAEIECVLTVSVAEETEWKWDLWWHDQKIDPILELKAKRMIVEYPDEEIEVDLWFYTTSDKEADLNNVRTLVENLGGNVTWVGLMESEGVGQVLVSIPLEAVDMLAAYDNIRTLRTDGPLIPG